MREARDRSRSAALVRIAQRRGIDVQQEEAWRSGAVLEAPAVVAGLDDVAVMRRPIEQLEGSKALGWRVTP
jgi:hypothetical protein